jgi:hypothetical protein
MAYLRVHSLFHNNTITIMPTAGREKIRAIGVFRMCKRGRPYYGTSVVQYHSSTRISIRIRYSRRSMAVGC